MIIHDILQGSFEWDNLRAGRFTATDASELMPDQKKGTPKVGLRTLAFRKAAYIITGNLPDKFESLAMQRGKEREPKARALYQEITGNKVQEVGFVELDEYAGCSPDGLVGSEGLIEIKCKEDHNHLYAICNEYIDPDHLLQMQYQMLVTGRNWCDYVLYNPLFGNPIYIKRVNKDPAIQDKLIKGLDYGREIIKTVLKTYEDVYLCKKNYPVSK